ncbi:ABC-type multidrug transport system, ATPase component [Lachnospiraceae bacterium NE2001]|nr:ABC-type multidrug transport system, ATPase component [Lachnospiraceae bacterium NE2001]
MKIRDDYTCPLEIVHDIIKEKWKTIILYQMKDCLLRGHKSAQYIEGLFMEKIITLENVTKTYGGKTVIDSVSHNFMMGESIAFAGHNGCGKSTMLKILGGLIRIEQGQVSYHKKVRFSYVPEKFPGNELPMQSYLQYVADMEGVSFTDVDKLIQDFFLDSMRHTKMKNMSKGSLQKVGVIQALMAPHDILLLDEPLSGQDMDSQVVFIDKVNQLRDKGVTIFMSCHEKKLMDNLSDHVFTINEGKLEKLEDVSEGSQAKTQFKVYVRMNDKLTAWPDMIPQNKNLVFTVKREDLQEAVTKIFKEGWELAGVEEYI